MLAQRRQKKRRPAGFRKQLSLSPLFLPSAVEKRRPLSRLMSSYETTGEPSPLRKRGLSELNASVHSRKSTQPMRLPRRQPSTRRNCGWRGLARRCSARLIYSCLNRRPRSDLGISYPKCLRTSMAPRGCCNIASPFLMLCLPSSSIVLWSMKKRSTFCSAGSGSWNASGAPPPPFYLRKQGSNSTTRNRVKLYIDTQGL